MAEYIHYQDYYTNEFLVNYKKVKDFINFLEQNGYTDESKIYHLFRLMFKSACQLIKYFLNNNGLFQFSESDVLKEACYIELIDNGDEWFELLELYNINEENSEKIRNILKKNFFIIDELKNKMDGYINNVT